MMMSSLVHDGDLVYAPEDLARLEAHPFRDAPAALFLVKTPDDYRYGKPVLYPLLATPFAALFGPRGFLVLNFLCFALAFGLAIAFLRRRGGPGGVALAALVFGASAFPAYVLWLHPDMMNAALLAAAFFLALGADAPGPRRNAAAAAVFALATIAKSVNALYAAPWIVLLAARGRRRGAAIAASAVVLAAAAPALLGALGVEAASPYAGERYVYFDPQAVPYSDGWTPAADAGLLVPAASQTYSPKGIAYSLTKLGGIFFGRVSGLLPHFFPLVLLVAAMRRFDGRQAALLASLALFVVISVFFRSDYFGGPALGNRYFHLYPAMVLLADRVRWRAPQIALAAAALALGLPFFANPLAHSLFPMTHTVRAPHAWFAKEPTAAEDFYYVVCEFGWDATAGAVGRGLDGARPEDDVRFGAYEPREVPWAPGVTTYGLSRSMPLVQEARSLAKAERLQKGRSELLLRIANSTTAEGAPVPVTFVFESTVSGRPTEIVIEAGGDRVAGRIEASGGTAEARVEARRGLRYDAAHRTPKSVFAGGRERVTLFPVAIETNEPVLLKGVRAPGRDAP